MGIQFNINKCNIDSQFSIRKNNIVLTPEVRKKLITLGYKLKENNEQT